jgi:FtsZ-interacting cell division protein ZipA
MSQIPAIVFLGAVFILTTAIILYGFWSDRKERTKEPPPMPKVRRAPLWPAPPTGSRGWESGVEPPRKAPPAPKTTPVDPKRTTLRIELPPPPPPPNPGPK